MGGGGTARGRPPPPCGAWLPVPAAPGSPQPSGPSPAQATCQKGTPSGKASTASAGQARSQQVNAVRAGSGHLHLALFARRSILGALTLHQPPPPRAAASALVRVSPGGGSLLLTGDSPSPRVWATGGGLRSNGFSHVPSFCSGTCSLAEPGGTVPPKAGKFPEKASPQGASFLYKPTQNPLPNHPLRPRGRHSPVLSTPGPGPRNEAPALPRGIH